MYWETALQLVVLCVDTEHALCNMCSICAEEPPMHGGLLHLPADWHVG